MFSCSSHCLPRLVLNEIDNGKVNAETHSGTAVLTRATSKNYKTCKHMYKLCHINQTGQSTT